MRRLLAIICLAPILLPPTVLAAEAVRLPPPASAAQQRAETLDRLYARLKTAPDAESAKRVVASLSAIQRKSGSPTADLLLKQATAAADAGAYGTALDMLDVLIDQHPEFTEAINERATIHYLAGDYEHSVADIEVVLKAEPRHFGALAGLGLIRRAQGREQEALEAFRAALEVYPKMPGMAEAADELARKLEKKI